MSSKHSILMPPAEKAPLHTGNIFVWLWYFISPYKWLMIAYAVYRLIRYTWFYMMPLVIGHIIDGFESGDIQENREYYIIFLAFYMIVFLIFLDQISFKPETAATQKAIRIQTLYSINHLNKLSLNWHEQQGSGGKIQRIMTARKGNEEILRYIRWDVFPLIGAFSAAILSVILMDVPLFYLAMYAGFISSYVFVSWYFARPFVRLFDRFNSHFEKLLSGVYEFMSSIRTVKSFHLKKRILSKASVLEVEGQEAIMDAFHANLMRWTLSNFVGGLWVFTFAWVGFYQTLQGNMTTGLYASTFFLAYSI